MAAEPMFSIKVTMMSRRECSLRQTSANARSGLSPTRPWNSGRSRSFTTANSTRAAVTAHAGSDSVSAQYRAASWPSASAPISHCMVTRQEM